MNAELQETVDTLKYLRRGVKRIKTINDYLINHGETPEINWKVAGMIKGATFGEYLKMRREGSGLIAKHVLLEEGISQKLSPRQEVVLAHYDEQYNL